MIRAWICIVCGVLAMITFSNGETGAGILAIVIGLILLGMGSAERKDSQAYVSRRDFWREIGGFR